MVLEKNETKSIYFNLSNQYKLISTNMTDLHIKIKNQKNKSEESGKKWVVYELEEKVEYGDNDYSEIKLEYDVDKKLERLQPGKDLVLQIFADNKC